MRGIVAGDRPVSLNIRRVLEICRAHGSVRIVERSADRVRALHHEALLERSPQLDRAPVIDRFGSRCDQGDRREARIEAVEPAVQQIAHIAIDVVGVVQVSTCRPEVVCIHDDSADEVSLEPEEPVVRVGHLQVRIDRRDCHLGADHAVSRIQANPQCRIDWIAEIGLGRIAETVGERSAIHLAERHGGAQRRVVTIVLGRKVHQPVVRDAIAAAHGHARIAGRVPGKSNARRHIVVVRRVELVDEIHACRREPLRERRPGTPDQISKRTVLVHECAVVLVAHAGVDGELPVHLPVVVQEDRPLGLPQFRVRRHRLAGARIDVARHLPRLVVGEIQNTEEGVRRNVIRRVHRRSVHPAELPAHLPGMGGTRPREDVLDVPVRLPPPAGITRRAETGTGAKFGDRDPRHLEVRRRVRCPDQAHHAHTELVELARIEDVRVVHVSEMRRFENGDVECGPDVSVDGVRGGPIHVAVQPVLARPQFVVHPRVDLVAAAPRVRHVERGADIRDAVGGTGGALAGRRTSEIAEVRRGVGSRREIAQQPGGDAGRTSLQDEVAELGGFNGEQRAARAGLSQPFVGREEEDLVADDRSAHAVSELVFPECRHLRLEHIPGRERVVLEIVGTAAVQLVRSALGDHLDLRPAVAAVHGGEVVGDHAHFLDRFGVGRQVRDAATRDAVRARVVDGEGIGLVALTAGVDARRGLAGEGVVAGTAGAERGRNPFTRDARLERDQVIEVAAVERHLLQLDAVHSPRDAALLRLNQRRGRGHGHAFDDA